MFLLKSLSLCCLGNCADFHTGECGAAQNLSAWFAPGEARTPSPRPGGNLRGRNPLVSLQSSNHKTLRRVRVWPDSPSPPTRQEGAIRGVRHTVMNYGWWGGQKLDDASLPPPASNPWATRTLWAVKILHQVFITNTGRQIRQTKYKTIRIWQKQSDE